MQKKILLSETIINIDFNKCVSSIDNTSIKNFENSLESFYGNEKKVVSLNSGTSAIHLALILSGVEEGDEVICQSFTYVATAGPILYQKATPVFVDSEKDTWNMCPVQLEIAIKDRIKKRKKPKAIIFVHSYGMPAKVDEIVLLSKKYNIPLIEDSAEALGSIYKGKKCGSFGDFGVLSFNNNKIISTLGGGALICKSDSDKQKAVFYATQARENAFFYKHEKIGYNYRMNSFAAAIGVSELKMLTNYLKKRSDINDFYKSYFSKFSAISFLTNTSKNNKSNHWLSCFILKTENSEYQLENLMLDLQKNNIETRFLWKPMHLQPLFNDFPYYGGSVSENLFKKGLCLPSGYNLTKTDINRVSQNIEKLL